MRATIKQLLLVGTLFASGNALAENAAQYVRITTETEEAVYVQIAQSPLVNLTAEGVKVTVGEDELLFPFASGAMFEIVSETAVRDASDVHAVVAMNGGILSIAGLNAAEVANVYSASGAVMASGKADSNGSWSVATAGWTPGVYVVKTNKLTTKLIIK